MYNTIFSVITTEAKNILVRNIYQRAEEKVSIHLRCFLCRQVRIIVWQESEFMDTSFASVFHVAVETEESRLRTSNTRAWMQAT